MSLWWKTISSASLLVLSSCFNDIHFQKQWNFIKTLVIVSAFILNFEKLLRGRIFLRIRVAFGCIIAKFVYGTIVLIYLYIFRKDFSPPCSCGESDIRVHLLYSNECVIFSEKNYKLYSHAALTYMGYVFLWQNFIAFIYIKAFVFGGTVVLFILLRSGVREKKD